MQGSENEIIIAVRLTKEQVEEDIQRLRKQIAGLRAEKEALAKAFKGGSSGTETYAAAIKQIDLQIKTLSVNVREGSKSLREMDKAEQDANRSFAVMRENLRNSAVITQDLTHWIERASGSTGALQNEVEGLNSELNKGIGTLKREVASINDLDEAIERLEAEYKGLTGAKRTDAEVGGKLLSQISALTKEQDKNQRVIDNSRKGVQGYIRDINVLGINVGSTIESFAAGAQGVGTFGKAIFTSRGALIALTAVPIVLLLTGIITLLTKSQKGMDFLARATGAVTAVFSALTNQLVGIGDALIGVWENPKKAALAFGQFIQQNLINRFKAFGVILDAIKSGDFGKLADGVIQLGTGVTDATGKLKKFGSAVGAAAQKGIDLANASKAIEEAEIRLNVQRGKSKKLIEQNKQLSEDTTKSAATRIAAARRAFNEEEKLQKAEQDNQLRRINLAKAEAKAGQNTRDQQRKISEEQQKYDELEADATGRRTEIKNNINSITAEAAAKAKEDRAKATKEMVDEAELALILAKRKGEGIIEVEQEVLKRTIDFVQARADAEKEAVEKGTGAAAQRKLIQAKADTEILEATTQMASKVSEIAYTAQTRDIETSLALTRKGTQAELKLRIEAIEAERNKQQEAAKLRLTGIDLDLENGRLVNTAARAISEAKLSLAQVEVARLAELGEKRIQIELDMGDQSLSNEREAAAARINLEEETQKKLLELDLEYNQISDADYLTKLNAIQGKAIAARKVLGAELRKDELANEQAILDQKFALTADGSIKELKLQREQLELQRKAAVAVAKLTKEQIKAINAEFDEKQGNLTKEITDRQISQIVEAASQGVSAISQLVEGSILRQTSALDQQEKAVLSSAALTADQRAIIEEKFAKKRQDLERQSAQKRQKIASLENIISVASATAANLKTFAINPILGLITQAIIIAKGVATQVLIDNQKFATGGYVSDRRGNYVTGPGTGKSDSISARISNGESVINAKSTAKHYALLSAINRDGGGRSFPGLGVSAPKVNREALRGFSAGGVNALVDQAAISRAIRDGMRGVRIVTVVEEFRKVESDALFTENQADL